MKVPLFWPEQLCTQIQMSGSQCKNGAGHRVNMINVLKKEQSLRDRGRNATGIGRDLGEKLAKKEGIRAPE